MRDEPSVGIDVEHTGPGTLAGRYLRSFWQPVYHADDLAPGRTVPLRVMSEDFTLYRGASGRPYLLDFRCAHRGMQLSAGPVEGDCIRCFYHGWRYDGTGQCVEQPAEPQPFADKVRLRAYPVREYLGLVFAYLGEGDPPPLPRYPDFEEFEGLLEHDSYRRACNYFQNLENSIDHTHVGFVHKGQPGSFDGLTDSPLITVEESEWGITCHIRRPSRTGMSQFGMPNVFHLQGLPNDPEVSGYREFLAWWVPIDDESHMQFGVYAVRVPPDRADVYRRRRDARLAAREIPSGDLAEAILAGRLRLEDVDPRTTDVVRLTDDIAQIGQGRVADRRRDRLGRADAGVILIRKLWTREMRALAEGRPPKAWSYDASRLMVAKS